MPLNSSGQLSLGGATAGESVNLELGKAASAFITMNDTDLRTLFGIASGSVSMSSGYGKSSFSAAATRGYFGGSSGFPNVGTFNTIDRFTFSTESIAVIGATLTSPLLQFGGTGVNNTTKGYSNAIASVGGTQSITFASETTANVAQDLVSQISPGGEMQSTTKGYIGGGNGQNVIQALTFSNESYAIIGATVPYGVTNPAGVNSSTRGYFAGGSTPSTTTGINDISGLNFSSETTIDPAATLVQSRRGPKGVNSSTRAYFGGGRFTPIGLNQIDGLIFSSETSIDPGAGLVQARESCNTVNSSTRGYFAGGSRGPSNFSQIDGILFASESTIDPAANLNRTDGGIGVNDSNN